MREGVLPDYPNSRAPQFDFDDGQLVVPHPPTNRAAIQESFVRDQEIDPKEYYPVGYHPQLLPEWPVDADLVVPLEAMPAPMVEGMGEAWQKRQAYKKHVSSLAAPPPEGS